jgi:competence protein ComEA
MGYDTGMNSEGFWQEVKTHWWQAGLMGVGVVLIVIGIVAAQGQTRGEALVIQEATASPQVVKVVVIDVAGAIQQPGIYRLPEGARLGEAIVAAGGLAAQADRSYVARFINQAELVRDGMKLYIPEVGESVPTAEIQALTGGSGVVSVNQASASELDSLWGIGEARVKTIIENRPYSSLEELVSKAGIPDDVLEKNQGKMGL